MTESQEMIEKLLQHYTETRLADLLKVSQATVRKWRLGDRNIHPARMPQIRRILTRLERRESQ
jgi:DNA-binding transcriptional regulator YdaS (Cro superfamily)